MMRFIIALVVLAGIASLSWAGCFAGLDPGMFAEGCPIIVAGTIEEIVEAAPAREGALDTAKIRIDVINRNELTDVPLKGGDLLAVKMISKNNQFGSSTDIRYPVKTKAVWLVLLTSKGEFRIDRHPVQKQQVMPPRNPVEKAINVRYDNAGQPVNVTKVQGTKTKAEWVAWEKRKQEEWAKSLAAHEAQEKAIRDLANHFAAPDGLNDKVWKRYQASDAALRLSLFQMSENGHPMIGARFGEVVQGAVLHEKDEHIRAHAVIRLGYFSEPGDKGAQVLAAGLRDPSADVRMYACQSVGQRRYVQLTDQVKQLQNDPDAKVREMATHTLERWQKNPK
ncbi:MAG: HEAT repeat domain-containing protein [Planctomycetes bacterium]|nr:HEAT repeat domain-containing protein [Planctomycetota bacterium]